MIYLLTLLLKHATKSYTNTLCFIHQPHILALLVFANAEFKRLKKKPKELKFYNARIEYSN